MRALRLQPGRGVAAWAAADLEVIRNLRGFSEGDLASATGLALQTTRRYVQRLRRWGYLALVQRAGGVAGEVAHFQLLKDTGIVTPCPDGAGWWDANLWALGLGRKLAAIQRLDLNSHSLRQKC